MKIGCFSEKYSHQCGTTIWESATGEKFEVCCVCDNEEDAKQYCEKTGGHIVSKTLVSYCNKGQPDRVFREEKMPYKL